MSVLLFAGWPNIAKGVREAGTVFSIALTGSMTVLALSFFPSTPAGSDASASSAIGGPRAVFLAVIVLVNVVGPLGLWFAWRWKMTRAGGWDAAKVTLRKRRMSTSRG
jgi:phosphatidylinositol glycan class C protein